MITVLGAIASILFAISAVPETIKTIKTRRTGTPTNLAFIVLSAVVTMWLYMTIQHGLDLWFTINSITNTICWTVLLIYGVISR